VFDVEATGSANWVNTIPAGNITADGGISNTTPVAATLTYNAPTSLTLTNSTNPSTLTFPGQVSQLTITITNGTQAVTGLALTDYFTTDGTAGGAASGMVIAGTPGGRHHLPRRCRQRHGRRHHGGPERRHPQRQRQLHGDREHHLHGGGGHQQHHSRQRRPAPTRA
jgi:hypothetical protein